MSKFIEGFGAPTTATPGFVDSLYIDMDTLSVYKCTKVTPAVRETSFVAMSDYTMETSEYTWEAVGGSGGGGADSTGGGAILAEMQEITYNQPESEYNGKYADIIPANFEEFDTNAIYIVHWNGTKYACSRRHYNTVAESISPSGDCIVEEEYDHSVWLHIARGDAANNTFSITACNEDGKTFYRITDYSNDGWFFDETGAIAIERVVSAIS